MFIVKIEVVSSVGSVLETGIVQLMIEQMVLMEIMRSQWMAKVFVKLQVHKCWNVRRE